MAVQKPVISPKINRNGSRFKDKQKDDVAFILGVYHFDRRPIGC